MRWFLINVVKGVAIAALSVAALWVFVEVADRPTPEKKECRVTYVYDGDTVAMECGAGEMTARVQGLNAPETRDAQCEAERALGKAATLRLRALVKAAGEVTIERHGHDKYGRDLIRLELDGVDVADQLVKEGLAETYRGGKRRDWCADLGR